MPITGRFYKVDEDTEQGHFSSVIFYQDIDHIGKTDKEMDELAAKESRTLAQNWVKFVTEQSSKPPEKPKVEDLKEQADQLEDQWTRMIAQLSEVGSKEDIQEIADKLDVAVAETAASVEAKPISKDPIKEVDPIEEVKP
jgi:hypothetical protein